MADNNNNTPKFRGRPHGAVNKVPALVKDNIVEAFERLGGVKGMVDWANFSNKNLTEFYRLYARLLPRNIELKNDGNPLSLTVIKYEDNRSNPQLVTAIEQQDAEDTQLLERLADELQIVSVGSEALSEEKQKVLVRDSNTNKSDDPYDF